MYMAASRVYHSCLKDLGLADRLPGRIYDDLSHITQGIPLEKQVGGMGPVKLNNLERYVPSQAPTGQPAFDVRAKLSPPPRPPQPASLCPDLWRKCQIPAWAGKLSFRISKLNCKLRDS